MQLRWRAFGHLAARVFGLTLALALAMRALVPLGYMPRASSFDLAFVICHGSAEAAGGDRQEGRTPDEGAPACPFASTAHRIAIPSSAVVAIALPREGAADFAQPNWQTPVITTPPGSPGARAPPELL